MGHQAIRTVACGLIILLPLSGYAEQSSILGPMGRDNRPEKESIAKRPPPSDEILSQSFLIQVAAREALMQAENLKIELSDEKNQCARPSILEAGMRLKQKVSDIQNQADLLSAAQLKHKRMLNQDSDYRAFSAALSDLNRFANSWEERSSSPDYWKDNQVANRDLLELKRDLENAMKENARFTSNHLTASVTAQVNG